MMDPTARDFLVKVRFKYVEVKYQMYWLYSINTSYEDHIRWTQFHHGTITGAGIKCKKIPWLWRARLAKNKKTEIFLVTRPPTCWKPDFHFFSIRVFFTGTDDSQDSRGKEGTIFYFTLPLPPAHEHWDIYLQLCMWDDYHEFLIATVVFTGLLLDDIYHLI